MKRVISFGLSLIIAVGVCFSAPFTFDVNAEATETITDTSSQTHVVEDYQSKYDEYSSEFFDGRGVPLDGSSGTVDMCIPGLSEDYAMVPQGIAYCKELDSILISAYYKKTGEENEVLEPSVIYALDYSTGVLKTTYTLYKLDSKGVKTDFTGHVGGIAVSGKNVYIASGFSIYYLSLDDFQRNVESADLIVDNKYNLSGLLNKARCSYVTITDDILWTGNFYNKDVDENDQPASSTHNSVILGFKLTGTGDSAEWNAFNKSKPDYTVKVPNGTDHIQCATVAEGNVFLSQSFGRSKNSSLLQAKVTLGEEMTFSADDAKIIKTPSMMESFFIKNCNIYTLFESATYYYNDKNLIFTSKNPTDVVWRIDVNDFVSTEANSGYVSQGDLTFKLSEDGNSYILTSCKDTVEGRLTIPETFNGLPVTSIGDSAFYYCESLTSVTIPSSVESIGNHAFYGCSSLTSITIPDSVTSIGKFAFSGTRYYKMYWKDNALYIGNHLIEVDKSLSGEYEVKKGTKTIAGYAFYNCTSLTSVIIPDSVTSICYYAFYNCTKLTSITIPDSVTNIEIRALGYRETFGGYIGNSAYWEIVKVHGFIIYGKKGTAAETYANENSFKFEEAKVKNKLDTPAVKVKNSATGVKVTWKAIDGAESYKVYRKTYSTKTKKWGSWKTCGTVTATSYVDTKAKSGTKYIYTVKALNGDVKSGIKNSSSILFLSQPTVKIANASTGVKVKWNKITGASGYKVYRAEYANGKWSSWKSVKTITKGSTVSWTDKKVTSGVKYKYTVKAVNGKVASTYKSSSSLLYLAQPKTTVKVVSSGINVAWTQSLGATSYTVYRAEYNATTKKWSGWKNMGTAKKDKKSWTDKKAKKGVTYKYTVRAVKGGFKSTYKASASVKR